VPMDASWSDVGSWSSLWEVNDKDAEGNAVHGDVMLDGVKNSYLYSQNKLVTAVGVEDLIIVETKDALLVANKNKVQDVKNIVNRLKAAHRNECLVHRETYSPWGSADMIADGSRFKVKQVTVKPGGKTSMQKHYHRAEHWVVVSGTAKVFKADEEFLLTENQSIYIPVGVPHAIENPGKLPLEIIEVRSGSYLEEDDVERIEVEGYCDSETAMFLSDNES
jgi:mannose-1-phosphate guanylyltransferase